MAYWGVGVDLVDVYCYTVLIPSFVLFPAGPFGQWLYEYVIRATFPVVFSGCVGAVDKWCELLHEDLNYARNRIHVLLIKWLERCSWDLKLLYSPLVLSSLLLNSGLQQWAKVWRFGHFSMDYWLCLCCSSSKFHWEFSNSLSFSQIRTSYSCRIAEGPQILSRSSQHPKLGLEPGGKISLWDEQKEPGCGSELLLYSAELLSCARATEQLPTSWDSHRLTQ